MAHQPDPPFREVRDVFTVWQQLDRLYDARRVTAWVASGRMTIDQALAWLDGESPPREWDHSKGG